MDSDRRHDLNHEDASRTCRRLNAELVSVDTDQEFELLKREIRQRVTATGQEFAHEQWWTAGRFMDQRWVWDKQGYPPGKLHVVTYRTAVVRAVTERLPVRITLVAV